MMSNIYQSLYSFTAMNEDRYIIKKSLDYQRFAFISEGRHGKLIKLVIFEEVTKKKNTFNLALGTILPDGTEDYFSTTNNGDRNKVLSTVAHATFMFFEAHPNKSVYFTGSDYRRTVLYQRAISYGYDELIKSFVLYGEIILDSGINDFVPFNKEENYIGFLVEKRR